MIFPSYLRIDVQLAIEKEAARRISIKEALTASTARAL
jgi:hypothetical protein